MRTGRLIWLVAAAHLVLSLVFVFGAFALAMNVSGERDFSSAGVSPAKQAAALAAGGVADSLLWPVAYCDSAHGGCAWVSRWVPGAWSWLLLPANSLAWGAAAAGGLGLARRLRRPRPVGSA